MNRTACLCFLIAAGASPSQAQTPLPQSVRDGLARQSGRVVIPEGRWVLTEPLSLRDADHLTLVGEGRVELVASFPKRSKLPVIDMTGAKYSAVEDVIITVAPNAEPPACAVFTARTTYLSANMNRLKRVRAEGRFALAVVVNVGGEVNSIRDCMFSNLEPGGHGFWTSGCVIPDVAVPFWKGNNGRVSNVDHVLDRCYVDVHGRTGTEVAVWIGPDAGGVRLTHCDVSAKTIDDKRRDKGALAAFYLHGDPYSVNGLTLSGCWVESPGAVHGLIQDGTAHDVTIRDTALYGLEEAVSIRGMIHDLNVTSGRWGSGWGKYDWKAAPGPEARQRKGAP